MIDFNNKRLLITGGGSMLSKAIQRVMKPLWPDCYIDAVLHSQCDFTDLFQTRKRFLYFKPDYVIHLANFSGNNQFNQKYPAETFYRCTQIGLNVLQCCHTFGVQKCLSVIPSCAYPASLDVLREEDFWNGAPHSSVESHGLARRNTVAFGKQLNKISTTKFVSVVFNLLYGPEDSYDLTKTKVVGAFIKKYCDAVKQGNNQVVNWGDGTDRREFLYVDDAAEGLLRAFQTSDEELLNIGRGVDLSIKSLARVVSDISGFTGETVWDVSKGGTQKQKLLSNEKMKKVLNWQPTTKIEDGLRKTIEWYKKEYC